MLFLGDLTPLAFQNVTLTWIKEHLISNEYLFYVDSFAINYDVVGQKLFIRRMPNFFGNHPSASCNLVLILFLIVLSKEGFNWIGNIKSLNKLTSLLADR